MVTATEAARDDPRRSAESRVFAFTLFAAATAEAGGDVAQRRRHALVFARRYELEARRDRLEPGEVKTEESGVVHQSPRATIANAKTTKKPTISVAIRP